MTWHDCKTDPPKKEGEYLLVYSYRKAKDWSRAIYNGVNWIDEENNIPYGVKNSCYYMFIPYKWAEIDLSEVE